MAIGTHWGRREIRLYGLMIEKLRHHGERNTVSIVTFARIREILPQEVHQCRVRVHAQECNSDNPARTGMIESQLGRRETQLKSLLFGTSQHE